MTAKPHDHSALGRHWWRTVVLLMAWEIAANRRLAGVSLVVGGLPYLAPWLPSMSHLPASDVRRAMVLGLGGFFCVVLHIVLGSSFWVRDLAERRSAFYFARPLAGSALAMGKVLGVWAVALGCQVFLFLGLWLEPLMQGRLMQTRGPGEIEPLFMWSHQYSLMMTQDSMPAPLPWVAMPILWALASLALLLGVHAVALWMRARSLWLLLDLLALLLLGALGRAIIGRLESVQALGALVWMMRSGFVVMVVALLLALWAQVHWGRTQLQRSHRAFSLMFWSVLGGAVWIAGGYSRHVVSPGPDDVTQIYYTSASPASPWLMVGGRTRHRSGFLASFLVNTDSGRVLYLGGLDIVASWFTYSGDGSRAAWLRCRRLSRPMDCEVWHLNLEGDSAQPQASGIFLKSLPDDLALSPRGRRVAMVRGQGLEVYDLATARLILSQRQASNLENVLFLTESRLRLRAFGLVAGGHGELGRHLLEVSVDSGETQTTGRTRGSVIWDWTHRRGDIDRILFQTLFPSRITLMDGATGETLWARPTDPSAALHFLADGRVVMRRHDKTTGHLELEVTASDGEILLRLERQGVKDVVLGGEWATDQLWVSLLEEETALSPLAPASIENLAPSGEQGWRLYSLDTIGGELRPIVRGLRPLRNRHSPSYEAEVGSPATRLFRAAGGVIVHWDPETGQGRQIFTPSP